MVSVKMLIQAGLLAPGQTLSVRAGADTMKGVLGEDGRIRFDGGEYASLSAFAQRALCKAGRNRKAAAGWNEVKLETGRPIDDVRREYMKRVDGGRIDAAYQQGLEWSQGANAGIRWREVGAAVDDDDKEERSLRPRRTRRWAEGSRRGQGKGRVAPREAKHKAPAPVFTKVATFVRGGLRGRRKARQAEGEHRRCAIASLAEAAALVEGGVLKAAELKEISYQTLSGPFPFGRDAYRGGDGGQGQTISPHEFARLARKRVADMDALPGKERWKRGRMEHRQAGEDKYFAAVGPSVSELHWCPSTRAEVGSAGGHQARGCQGQLSGAGNQSLEVNGCAAARSTAGHKSHGLPGGLGKAFNTLSIREQVDRKEEEKLARQDGYSYGEWIARSSTSFLADKNSGIMQALSLEGFMTSLTEKERDQLLQLLPKCDREALLENKDPFDKEVFKSHVARYHALLGKGLLERDSNTHWIPPRGRTDESRLQREMALQMLALHIDPKALLAVQEGMLTVPDALLGFEVEEDGRNIVRPRKNGSGDNE
ncbi:unnamed protein product [Ostreobium quekettii]|uniref:RAMA domain-containing protein n=1 Tax=Ostreobium quekettii TaxID=121088 RepID=A0A8S1J445_9CHLO|nr:unnamed protein product [Ostreobium quekettii]